MAKPLDVVIVLPVFNGAPFVAEAIDSVLAQTASSWRLLIVDDASADASRDIVTRYRDPRISVTSQRTNVGLYGTLRSAIAGETAEWIAILMQDDRLHPDYLRTMTAIVGEHPRLDGVWAGARTIDARGAVLAPGAADEASRLDIYLPGTDTWRRAVRQGCIWTISGSLTRRRAFTDIPLRVDLPHCGDFDWFLRASRARTFARAQRTLIDLRRHKGQASARHMREGRHLKETHIVLRDALCRHPGDLPVWQVGVVAGYRAGQCVRTMARNAVLGHAWSVPRLAGTGIRFLALPARVAAWRRRQAGRAVAAADIVRDAGRR